MEREEMRKQLGLDKLKEGEKVRIIVAGGGIGVSVAHLFSM